MLGKLGPETKAIQPEDEPHPLSHPARWPIVAAFGCLTAGGLVLPWGSYTRPLIEYGPPVKVVLSGGSGSGDGLTAFMLGLVLLGLAMSRGAATSRTRTVQWVPAVIGVAIVLVTWSGLNSAEDQIRESAASGWPATIEPGLMIERLGAILAAAGGIMTSIVVARGHPVVADPLDRHALDRTFVTLVIVGLAGSALAFGLVLLVVHLTHDDSLYAMWLFMLGLPAILLGPAVSVTTWRRWRRTSRARGR